MEWYREVQFIAAVPMPPQLADEFGTTVNGMWAAPERSSPDVVADTHRKGRWALFSVPMVALTPGVYEDPATAHLLDEVCRDVDGGSARCDWYYWEPKPVYAACIYSLVFRRYLLDRCQRGVDDGMDVVNLDEIMTSVGLMNRDPGGSGFCARCLERFRSQLRDDADAELAPADDDALRAAIRRDDRLYERYHRFHEREAFRVMVGFIEELRSHAAATNPAFAISANLAYLGGNVAALGALWGGLWGPHVDFVLMENDYRVERGGPHCLLPRGKFTAWYRLGSSFKGTPTWICPSIHVPRQPRRAGSPPLLRAHVPGGVRERWPLGYFWWPGVDARTRQRATAPDALKDHIRFIAANRELYERATSMNDLAVLYLDGPITRRPETHQKYLALAQALAEAGHQFDVLYGGDGEFNADELDPGELRRYRAILVPEARELGMAPAATLERYARSGGDLLVFSASPLDPSLVRHEDGQMLFDFWRHYREEDRERIVATVDGLTASRIRASHPAVGVLRYVLGDRHILHLLNYGYVAEDDRVVPVRDLRVRVPWGAAGTASCTLGRLDGERAVPSRIEGDELVLEVPELDLYAMLVLREVGGDGRRRRHLGGLLV